MAKTATDWTGPWVATFADGPHKGERRVWAVGPVWQEIRLAPLPGHSKRSFVAGGDGIPEPRDPTGQDDGWKPEVWPDETLYQLRSTKKTRELGEPTMVATYRRVRRPK